MAGREVDQPRERTRQAQTTHQLFHLDRSRGGGFVLEEERARSAVADEVEHGRVVSVAVEGFEGFEEVVEGAEVGRGQEVFVARAERPPQAVGLALVVERAGVDRRRHRGEDRQGTPGLAESLEVVDDGLTGQVERMFLDREGTVETEQLPGQGEQPVGPMDELVVGAVGDGDTQPQERRTSTEPGVDGCRQPLVCRLGEERQLQPCADAGGQFAQPRRERRDVRRHPAVLVGRKRTHPELLQLADGSHEALVVKEILRVPGLAAVEPRLEARGADGEQELHRLRRRGRWRDLRPQTGQVAVVVEDQRTQDLRVDGAAQGLAGGERVVPGAAGHHRPPGLETGERVVIERGEPVEDARVPERAADEEDPMATQQDVELFFEEGVAPTKGGVGVAREDGVAPVVARAMELEQPDVGLGIDDDGVVLEGLENVARLGLGEGAFEQVVVVGGDEGGELAVAGLAGEGAMQVGQRQRGADEPLQQVLQGARSLRFDKGVGDLLKARRGVDRVVGLGDHRVDQGACARVSCGDRGSGADPEDGTVLQGPSEGVRGGWDEAGGHGLLPGESLPHGDPPATSPTHYRALPHRPEPPGPPRPGKRRAAAQLSEPVLRGDRWSVSLPFYASIR